MDKGTIAEIVSRFSRALEARGIKPQRVILYGSHAGGTPREGSDIDLVVVSDDFTGKDFWERIDILSDILYEIFAPIEAVAMTPEEWEKGDSFIAHSARNGEVLYAA
jgi:predicted nucleotidyltransferase